MPEHVDPTVAVLAANQSLVTNLLNDHVADAYGRCAGCAPDPRRRPVWPCGPHGYAERAYRLRQRRQAS